MRACVRECVRNANDYLGQFPVIGPSVPLISTPLSLSLSLWRDSWNEEMRSDSARPDRSIEDSTNCTRSHCVETSSQRGSGTYLGPVVESFPSPLSLLPSLPEMGPVREYTRNRIMCTCDAIVHVRRQCSITAARIINEPRGSHER